MRKLILLALLLPFHAIADDGNSESGSDSERWNITGPMWYETKCGHIGMTAGVGVGEGGYVKPCSLPVRVCEFERGTISTPVVDGKDFPACDLAPSLGKLVKTELKHF